MRQDKAEVEARRRLIEQAPKEIVETLALGSLWEPGRELVVLHYTPNPAGAMQVTAYGPFAAEMGPDGIAEWATANLPRIETFANADGIWPYSLAALHHPTFGKDGKAR